MVRPGPPVERGTLQRVSVVTTAADWLAGTEVEQTEVATALVASGGDERILWARFYAFVWDSAGQIVLEWALLKCLASDATQNLDDTATWELLEKRGHILKRGWIGCGSGVYLTKFPVVKWEVFNVDLNDGEELRMLWRPVQAQAAQNVMGVLEYRIAGT